MNAFPVGQGTPIPQAKRRLKLRLLGEPELTLDGQRIDLEMGMRARELVAYLAIYPHQVHRREKLMDLLWPDKTTDRGLANLRRALFLLRTALGGAADDMLVVTDTAIGLRLEAVEVDYHGLQALLDAGSADDPAPLLAALAVYAGDFMGEAPPDWAFLPREALHRRVISAGLTAAAALEVAGRATEALAAYRRVLAIDLLEEAAHAGAIRLSSLLGDRSGAIKQYQLCRDLLERELNTAPGRELEAAYQYALDEPHSAAENPSTPPVESSAAARYLQLAQAAPLAAQPDGAFPTRPAAAPSRKPQVKFAWAALAALVTLMVAASLAVSHRLEAANRTADELVGEHLVASRMETLPVQSPDPAAVDAWFSTQVPYRVHSAAGGPGGFILHGGGLCDLAGELAATTVFYGPAGERVSVFKFPEGDLPLPPARQLAPRWTFGLHHNGHSIVYWSHDGLVYAVVSEMTLDRLAPVAENIAGS